jgi:hypothetical protein
MNNHGNFKKTSKDRVENDKKRGGLGIWKIC